MKIIKVTVAQLQYILEAVDKEKDLGVMIRKNLKASNQCVKIVKAANQILGMIKKTFTFKTKDNLLQLYKRLVRLHLKYCKQVWNLYVNKKAQHRSWHAAKCNMLQHLK